MTSIALMVLVLVLIGSGMLLCLWAAFARASSDLNAFVVNEATAMVERGETELPPQREPRD